MQNLQSGLCIPATVWIRVDLKLQRGRAKREMLRDNLRSVDMIFGSVTQ